MLDIIIIGGGQAGLSIGYYARRAKLDYLIIDSQNNPGGAWNHTWDSLRLFSPAAHSSLPGWMMPPTDEGFPDKQHVVDYLTKYEVRYQLIISRPETVINISKDTDSQIYSLTTDKRALKAKTVVFATGNWANKHIPHYPGFEQFEGDSLHSGDYKRPDSYLNKKVLVVGGGNSGAQIAAELSKHTATIWATTEPPNFLPPDINGKDLFDYASQKYRQLKNGENARSLDLGNIVQVPEVKEAIKNNIYDIRRTPISFTRNGVIWQDGREEKIDSVIWCTGFRPELRLLAELGVDTNRRIKTDGTKVLDIEGVWAVGLGNWTGFASATLIGVGRTSKRTIIEIQEYLGKIK